MSTAIAPIPLQITSSAFKENGIIPAKYGCEKENTNPPVVIKNIPAETKSTAIIIEAPDAPTGTFIHWIMWNIAPTLKMMTEENSSLGTQGKNGNGKNKYTESCPPFGTHHYHFKIYALDAKLDLKSNSGKQSLEKAMRRHIIAREEFTGNYNV